MLNEIEIKKENHNSIDFEDLISKTLVDLSV